MSLRIISGYLKGRRIATPDSYKTHPMSERARNAIFNQLQTKIVDAKVLDAFAGSGSLGLEALSRGANSAVFIDKDRIAQKVLAENLSILEKTDLDGKAQLVRASASSWLDSTEKQFQLGKLKALPIFDIIFADPPYNNPQFNLVERLLSRLNNDGILILSQASELPTFVPEYAELLSEKTHSGAKIVILSKK